MTRRLFAALLAPCLFLLGCSGSDERVVLYVSADEAFARDVVRIFEEQTGLDVDIVPDTEAKKTTGLVERLRREADRPVADVFWSSEIFQTIDLAEEGVLTSFESDATRDWPEALRDPERRWYAFAARPRVIAFHPERLKGDPPEAWAQLTQDTYRGRIVMADPRFGTTGGHLGTMLWHWDRNVAAGYYEAFLMGLRDNEVRLLPGGNAAVVRSIIDGDADLGPTDADDVWAARAQGYDIGMVYPAHDPFDRAGGTLLIPNTVARVKGGPNEAGAAALIEFLLSETVERRLAESTSHNVPLRPGLVDEYPDLAVPKPLRVDWSAAAARRRDAISRAMELLN